MTKTQALWASLVLATLSIAVAGTPAQADPPGQQTVFYFAGTMTLTSPASSPLFAPETEVVVKLEYDEAHNQVHLIGHDRVVGGAVTAFEDTMTRVGDTNVFDFVQPATGLFGDITWQGPEWRWNHWTYNLSSPYIPVHLGGYGFRNHRGMVLHYEVTSTIDGSVVGILDTIAPTVTEAEYNAIVADMEADLP